MAASPIRFRARVAVRCMAGLLCLFLMLPLMAARSEAPQKEQSKASSAAGTEKKANTKKKSATAKKTGTAKKSTTAKKTVKRSRSHRKTARALTKSRVTTKGRYSRAERIRRTARIRQEFVASSELRPMAQQLATMRTAAAYAGVRAYALRHKGEAAAAAYLALGHAYLLDRRYREAEISLREAREHDGDLADYSDYLGAEASFQAGDNAAAERLLRGFANRFPDSIFARQASVFEANVLLAMNQPEAAQRALAQVRGTDEENTPAFQLADARVALALGKPESAELIFKHLLLSHPLSGEAETARAKLKEMGAESRLTAAEMRSLGDAYYKAGRFRAAEEQYHLLAQKPDLSQYERNTFLVAEAACKRKLGRLTRAAAEALPDTNDENGARRLYLLMELARDRQDTQDQQSIVSEMERRFPQSQWLREALFSSGNMYLLRVDYPTAIGYYSYLAEHFPHSSYAPVAHWRAAWLTYRLGKYDDAARMFDEQIRLYPDANETVSAIYWRARLFERLNHQPAFAARNYRDIVRNYPHYYYALLSRVRLVELGDTQPTFDPQPAHFEPLPKPRLINAFPNDSPHLAKARLLANAGLNEYVAREIAADPDWSSWSSLAAAQIYSSYGETFLALRAMKRALPGAASTPLRSVPLAYWRILFPEPYWDTIKAESARYNLDPYLVASLIRQESEFNPSAVSYADAYGLMQLLPRVGRAMARQLGMRNFRTYQLLNPETNIRLGTRYLRQMLDKFGGMYEYALAAYNAGDYRVADWKANGPYSGMDEFVESIPFTETRNYVEAILRNVETYKAIDTLARAQAGSEQTALR